MIAEGIDPWQRENDIHEEERSHKNSVYRCMYLVVVSVSFNFFIFCLILANTITLAVYTFDQSQT